MRPAVFLTNMHAEWPQGFASPCADESAAFAICYTPYSEMAANKLFFCLHVNYPSSHHFHFKILLFCIHVVEAKRAN